MLLNHQMKCCHNCGSEIETNSEDGPIACRRMAMKEMIEMMIKIFSQVSGLSPDRGGSSSRSSEANFDSINLLGMVIEVMMIRKFPQLQNGPHVEDLSRVLRHQVSELIQPVLDKLQTIEQRNCEAETISTTSVRTLRFMFLDEVAGPVLTSKEIKSEEDNPIRVKLIDEKTGNTVNLGSESSLRAEIVLLDASDDNNENNWTSEDFVRRIIKEGDKKKPHFSKSQYIDLKEGVGCVRDTKLGHDKSWTKNSKCKLGVRLAGNIKGVVEVREAWTNSFTVCDSRGKLYEKGNPPCLSDPLWKLENIGRDGDPIKRLAKNNIKTVKDFRFLHSIDPMRLQKIVLGERRKIKEAASIPKWDAIVKHAMTCRIDDTNIYVHFPRSESQRGVVFDVVGGLKGLISQSHYICVDSLSEDDKDIASGLLLSAFENQNDIASFHDENYLLQRFPHPSNDIDIAANPLQEIMPAQVRECNPSAYRVGDGDLSTYETTLLEQFTHPSNDVAVASNFVQEVVTAADACERESPLPYFDFSTEQDSTNSLLDFQQYYNVASCFGASPGTMQIYEPNLIYAAPNQTPIEKKFKEIADRIRARKRLRSTSS